MKVNTHTCPNAVREWEQVETVPVLAALAAAEELARLKYPS